MLRSTKLTISLFFLFAFISVPVIMYSQASCTTASTLTPSIACSTTIGDLQGATNASPTGACGSATSTTTNGVWYKFTATSANATITVSNLGTNLTTTTTYLEVLNGTCLTSFTSIACQNVATSLSLTSLVVNTIYYVRIYVTGATTSNPGNRRGFDICIQSSPNDECGSAITLSDGITNSSGSVWTATSGILTGCATGNPDDDVWYKITPAATSLNIYLTAIGSNLSSSGAMIQLFSGSCGLLTSVACGTTTLTTTVTSGNLYFIRVYSFGTGSIGGTSSGSAFSITATATTPPQTNFVAGRMNEVFKQTILSAANILNDPWEITYGSDNYLWITEAKGYKVYRMDPVSGIKTTVLDISQGASGYLTGAEHTAFNVQFTSTQNPWPQGGMAGLALHPKFLDATAPKNYVYISYVHTYNGGSSPTGIFFTNSVVRFTYNTGTGKLESPVALCDTLPGSGDHNSQRMIIAPVGGTDFLFYASGDMGAGQFANRTRPQKAQNPDSYEGKILRFNLESDGDAGAAAWIPNDNPYSATSAVWCIGIRNNQGFAYDPALNLLYGSSHGPYSDDEINIIERRRNFGHPLVIGFAADGNYNGTGSPISGSSISAGTSYNDASLGVSSNPPIVDEMTNKNDIDANGNGLYKDPLFSAYAAPQGTLNPPSSPATKTIGYIWRWNPANAAAGGGWPSEGWSGLDLYTHTLIPGWYKSLVAASLKWGRLVKLRLSSTGIATAPANAASDTISYFGSTNRYRDIAFAPNGKDIYVIMDKSSTTSGPSAGSPIVPACAGCVQKYTFLGYNDVAGKSSIPTSIDVTNGTANTCGNAGTTIVIDANNSNLWVPITGPDGNIMAEIYANGYNLDTVRSSFYKNSGPIRIKNSVRYLDRNMTITPKNQPGASGVKIRLYFSKTEFDALDLDPFSAISSISDLKILKNTDNCSGTLSAATTLINPVFSEAHGSNGYMLQADISGFSSFYFASSNITLPLDLLTFKVNLINNNAALLQWQTANEINTSYFTVERSSDANTFLPIGEVKAHGSNNSTTLYSYTDNNILNFSSPVIYYRLKMTDQDGSFKYSGIVSVTITYITGKVTVAPNPVINDVKVNVSSAEDGKVQWKLIDNAGRVLFQNSTHVKKGIANSITISMDKLASGSYFLSVSGAGIDQKIKLQKL